LADLTSSDLPDGSFTPGKKKKVLEDTIDWLRTHDPSPEELDDGFRMAVCSIAGVRLPNGPKASLGRVLAMVSQDQCKAIRLSPKFKEKVVMESMEYLRK
jgi:hypothetical protein